MPQTLPPAAREYARAQRAEIQAAIAAVRRLWRRMGDDFDTSYARIELPLLETVYTAQGRVARGAQAFIPAVMAQTGLGERDREYEPIPEAWVGTAGDGRDVPGLLHQAVVQAKTAIAAGGVPLVDDDGEPYGWQKISPAQALQQAGTFLSLAVGTLLSDTARGMEQTEAKARKVGTFVRMLNPPSCGRCVILAGKTYGSSTAFLRHPGCDCRHIPAPESVARDLTVDPDEYLRNLDDRELARTLGSKANAEAYREYGADSAQLVNAYRRGGDVRAAQVYGRNVKFTTEGTTRRGWAYHRMAQADYMRAQGERRAGRYMRLRAPRLMPESIFQVASTREEQLRLLRLYGWVQ